MLLAANQTTEALQNAGQAPISAEATLDVTNQTIQYDVFGQTRNLIMGSGSGGAETTSGSGVRTVQDLASSFNPEAFLASVLAVLSIIMSSLQLVGALLALVLALGIGYFRYQTWLLRRSEMALYLGPEPSGPLPANVPAPENERWISIKEMILSNEPSEWRRAVLTADLMLDDLMERLGYSGTTLTEKLEQLKEEDFSTAREARHAHAFKEQMIEAGLHLELDNTDARQVLERYRRVLIEFNVIRDLNPLA